MPDRQKLHIKTVITMVEVGLHADEAEALVSGMTVAEMVHSAARVNCLRHFHAAHDVLMSTKPAGLAKHEAEALVMVLDDSELERTVLDAGLSIHDVAGNEAAIKHRAAIALQHPNRVLPAEQTEKDPVAEVKAREAALEQLRNAVLQDAPLKGNAAHIDNATTNEGTSADDSDADNADMSLTAEDGDILNSLIEPSNKDKLEVSQESSGSGDDWQDQVMGLFNVDRHSVFAMPLLSVGWMAEHLKHAVHHDTAGTNTSATTTTPAPESGPLASGALPAELAEVWDEAAYDLFWQSLSHKAQLVLTDLYGVGVLSKKDDIAKQARFVKAIGNAYNPEAAVKTTEHVHKTGHANNMAAHQAREARHRRNKAKGLHGSFNSIA